MGANFVRGYCEIELFITHSISLNPKARRKFLPTDLTYCLRKHYEKRLFSHAVTAVPVSDQILQGFCFCTLHLVDFPIRLAPSMRKAFFPFSVFFSDSSLSYIFRFSTIIILRFTIRRFDLQIKQYNTQLYYYLIILLYADLYRLV